MFPAWRWPNICGLLQIVKTVERILYAADEEEAKDIIAEAQRLPAAFTAGAAPAEGSAEGADVAAA